MNVTVIYEMITIMTILLWLYIQSLITTELPCYFNNYDVILETANLHGIL